MQSNNLATNPRESAGILSSLMFCFALPILFKGRKKVLEPEDFYKPLEDHRADYLGNQFYQIWESEVEKCRRNSKNEPPSIIKVMLRIFGWKLLYSGITIGILELGTRLTAPLLLSGLIAEFTINGNGSGINAKIYAALLILTIAGSVLFTHPYMMSMMHLTMRMRVAVSGAIYRKAIRLNRTALGDTTTGQMVNLISNDLGRIGRAFIHFHFLWLGPLELLLSSFFLYQQIGLASFYGTSILLLYLPFQAYLSKLTSRLRLKSVLQTDQRVRMMNEIISGIQVIKMYTWEKPFGKVIEQLRRSEMSSIRKLNYIRGLLQSFEITLGRIAIFVSLLGFVLSGGELTAERAFCVTAFYNILRGTMTKFFPSGMSQFAELLVSLRRIRTFMMRDELEVKDIEKPGKYPEGSIEIQQLRARWSQENPEPVLDNINISLKPHQLVAVIGPVGSGKSSLIQAILGELPPEFGSVKLNGRYSYASQEPWLFNGSVRDNILFGLPMDKQRYRMVVRKCALERDFLLLRGDKTIVGERGAGLSGGQRARISLARAVYRQADVYLLDDPLSAVDTHVGRHLFGKCMRGFLRHQLVVLVTHQLQFLEKADLILIMDKGKITAMGTYEEMLKSGQDFAQLIKDNIENEREEQVQAGGDAAVVERWEKISYSRRTSTQSTSSFDSTADSLIAENDDNPNEKNSIVQESRSGKGIGISMYHKYFSAGSGWLMFILIIVLCIGTQLLASGGDYFLSYWVKNKASTTSSWDIYYFSAINISLVICALVRFILFFSMTMHSSTNLHNSMFQGVLRTALHFFQTNPSGRILNRFAMDLSQVDEVLPVVMLDCINVFLTLTGIITILCITNPWYMIITLAMFVAFYFLREFYLKTSRNVKRLEAVARSPQYSHFSATLNGLPTIRALGAQRMLIGEYDNYQDLHSSVYYSFLSTSRAFGYYLDLFCMAYVISVTLTSFFNPPLDNPGQIGLAITQAMSMTGTVQWGMRESAELENSMTSVERVLEYKDLKSEGQFESSPDQQPLPSWPESGKIVAENLSLRYSPDSHDDYILKSVNFEINPREKVGIVGRTGAGKSSLINALFRLSYNEGALWIDKRNTQDMGLHDLRSKISIIPQEPVLFSGTMRYNLDPFDQYDDSKLWRALEEVHLKKEISDMPSGLQSMISEGGSNFSVGQRQLVCLARAILRENRILLMDEATANVDPQTDALIQSTIRRKFKDCTVLTIAHRLNTIMDSDKVLVLDAGQVVEFDSPYNLLTSSRSKVFYGMVMEIGKTGFELLFKEAQVVHDRRQKTI